MSNGDDANNIISQPVEQGIGETMKRQQPRVVHTTFAQCSELIEKVKRTTKLFGEIFHRNERAFADIPVGRCIDVGLCLGAKADLNRF